MLIWERWGQRPRKSSYLSGNSVIRKAKLTWLTGLHLVGTLHRQSLDNLLGSWGGRQSQSRSPDLQCTLHLLFLQRVFYLTPGPSCLQRTCVFLRPACWCLCQTPFCNAYFVSDLVWVMTRFRELLHGLRIPVEQTCSWYFSICLSDSYHFYQVSKS